VLITNTDHGTLTEDLHAAEADLEADQRSSGNLGT